MPFCDSTVQQQPVDDAVDTAGNTRTGAPQFIIDRWRKGRIFPPTNQAEAVDEIRLDFLWQHRFEMMRCNHALAQLFKLRRGQGRAKFRLRQQEDLQQRCFPQLEVGKHAQFFKRAHRQILRFIDDQQRAPPSTRFFVQEVFDSRQRVRLCGACNGNAQRISGQPQQISIGNLGRDQTSRRQPRWVNGLHDMADQRRLTRPHFTSDDDKALTLCQTIAQIGHGGTVCRAFKPKAWVRR